MGRRVASGEMVGCDVMMLFLFVHLVVMFGSGFLFVQLIGLECK